MALPATGQFSPAWVDFFIVMGAVTLMALVIFIWAILVRKRGRHHGHHHHRRTGNPDPVQPSAGNLPETAGPRRRRRRHRERRPANPTLADTGGLPPLREEEKTPPAPSS